MTFFSIYTFNVLCTFTSIYIYIREFMNYMESTLKYEWCDRILIICKTFSWLKEFFICLVFYWNSIRFLHTQFTCKLLILMYCSLTCFFDCPVHLCNIHSYFLFSFTLVFIFVLLIPVTKTFRPQYFWNIISYYNL